MKTKTLEIRDDGTHVAVLAIQMLADNELQSYHVHERCGYPRDGSGIIVMRLDDQRANVDPYSWGGRTMPVAHEHIYSHFNELNDGDVVDVRFLLGEAEAPAKSDRFWKPGD